MDPPPAVLWPVLSPQPVNDWAKQYAPRPPSEMRERNVGKKRLTPFAPLPTIRGYTIERPMVIDSGEAQCAARGARRRLLY